MKTLRQIDLVTIGLYGLAAFLLFVVAPTLLYKEIYYLVGWVN